MIKKIADEIGLVPEIVTYSEIQSGKSHADQKAQFIKKNHLRFVDANHNVLTHKDFLEAIRSGREKLKGLFIFSYKRFAGRYFTKEKAESTNNWHKILQHIFL